MKCNKCGKEKFVKNFLPFGQICIFCFSKKIDTYDTFKSEWLISILSEIKNEFIHVVENSNTFDMEEFLDSYPDRDLILQALYSIKQDTVPENIRVILSDYFPREEEVEEEEIGDEDIND